MKKIVIATQTLIRVRFSEVDSMGMVWHGHYIKYFEDGREDFGNKFGINYADLYKHGFLIPVVKITCDYRKPLVYGDRVLVNTRFVESESAKIVFDYTVFRNETQEVVARGSSTQVFLNMNHELLLSFPDFFLEWKKSVGL